MPRTRLYQYKAGSRSAKAIAEELGIMRLKHHQSRFRPRVDDTIINWGASLMPYAFHRATIINKPAQVAAAANKLDFFRNLSDQDLDDIIPSFWERAEDIPDDAFPIVARTILNGHSGAGLVIANTRDELVSARLYVKYMKKSDEFRIHVGGGNVISQQRKARRLDTPDNEVNWQVRNHANGFIFARQSVDAPTAVKDSAIAAVQALGLDFGAADVIWNQRTEMAYVLEVNTAPGVEGTTVSEYADYFRSVL